MLRPQIFLLPPFLLGAGLACMRGGQASECRVDLDPSSLPSRILVRVRPDLPMEGAGLVLTLRTDPARFAWRRVEDAPAGLTVVSTPGSAPGEWHLGIFPRPGMRESAPALRLLLEAQPGAPAASDPWIPLEVMRAKVLRDESRGGTYRELRDARVDLASLRLP